MRSIRINAITSRIEMLSFPNATTIMNNLRFSELWVTLSTLLSLGQMVILYGDFGLKGQEIVAIPKKHLFASIDMFLMLYEPEKDEKGKLLKMKVDKVKSKLLINPLNIKAIRIGD